MSPDCVGQPEDSITPGGERRHHGRGGRPRAVAGRSGLGDEHRLAVVVELADRFEDVGERAVAAVFAGAWKYARGYQRRESSLMLETSTLR